MRERQTLAELPVVLGYFFKASDSFTKVLIPKLSNNVILISFSYIFLETLFQTFFPYAGIPMVIFGMVFDDPEPVL